MHDRLLKKIRNEKILQSEVLTHSLHYIFCFYTPHIFYKTKTKTKKTNSPTRRPTRQPTPRPTPSPTNRPSVSNSRAEPTYQLIVHPNQLYKCMINLNIICFVIYIYIYSCLIILFVLPFVYIFLLLLCFFFSAAAYKFSNTTTNSKQQSYEYIIIIFCTVTKLIIRFLFYLTYPGESVSILLTSSVLFCFVLFFSDDRQRNQVVDPL